MFKNQLKAYLYERGVTAAEIARKTGVPKQTISDWLSGTRPRNMEYVQRIADALDVEISELLFGSQPKQATPHRESEPSKDPAKGRTLELFCEFVLKNVDANIFRILDLKTGHIIEHSDAWEKVLGWRSKDLKNTNWQELIHPEDRARVQEVIKRNLQFGVLATNCYYRERHKDGYYIRLNTKFSANLSTQTLMTMSVLAKGSDEDV